MAQSHGFNLQCSRFHCTTKGQQSHGISPIRSADFRRVRGLCGVGERPSPGGPGSRRRGRCPARRGPVAVGPAEGLVAQPRQVLGGEGGQQVLPELRQGGEGRPLVVGAGGLAPVTPPDGGAGPQGLGHLRGRSPFSWDQWDRHRLTSHPPSPRAPVGQACWQARQFGGQRVPSLGPVEGRARSVRTVPRNT